MLRVCCEAFRLIRSRLADGFVGCEPAKGSEPAGEVVGGQEVGDPRIDQSRLLDPVLGASER